MRVLVDEAYEQRAPLTSIARGMYALARLMKVEYEISQKSTEGVTDALAETLERMADELGLQEFTK